MFKRFISISIATIMVVMTIFPALALSTEETTQPSIEDVLNEYHERTFAAQQESRIEGQRTDTLKHETIAKLNEAGYEAYDVNPDTFYSVENRLKTDLNQLGLDPSSSYIIVVSGERNSTDDTGTTSPARKITDSPFTYTYNGITHTMRYLTIQPTDNMNYTRHGKSISLIEESRIPSIIQNASIP